MRILVTSSAMRPALAAWVILSLITVACAPSAAGPQPQAGGVSPPKPAQVAQSPALAEVVRKARDERELILQMSEPYRRMNTAEAARAMSAGIKNTFGVDINVRFDSSLGFPAAAAKALNEIQAGGAPSYDLMFQINTGATALYNEGLLERFDWLGLFPWLADSDLDYNGQALIATTQYVLPAYNTNLVRAADVPRTWEDLLDPKWKGKIASTIYQDSWTQLAEPAQWGEERTLEFVRRFADQEPKLGRFPEVNQKVVSGEASLAALNHVAFTIASKEQGAPIDYAIVEPMIVFVSILIVPKGAKHANAAALLAAWILSDEGQRMLEEGWASTSLYKPGTPAAELAVGRRLALPTLEFQLANTMRLQKQYEDLIIKK
jgi:ABC-type Fe3+ transport system substrate-binding protein